MSGPSFQSITWGGVSGTIALVGSILGIGRAWQRLATLERQMDEMRKMPEKVARIEEQTGATAKAIDRVENQVSKLVDHILDGRGRSYKVTPQ